MNLGEKLLRVRREAGLSQTELVALLKTRGFDVKKYTISKWESGASNPSVEAFLAICDVCRVDDIRRAFAAGRRIRLYSSPVSAGRGNCLGDDDYEYLEVEGAIPENTDYAVRVSGDSMTPRFTDGQIIFIHEQSRLDEGEIGIFFLNNEAYLKKLGDRCLISLNPEYKPIPIREHDEFSAFGKVVGCL